MNFLLLPLPLQVFWGESGSLHQYSTAAIVILKLTTIWMPGTDFKHLIHLVVFLICQNYTPGEAQPSIRHIQMLLPKMGLHCFFILCLGKHNSIRLLLILSACWPISMCNSLSLFYTSATSASLSTGCRHSMIREVAWGITVISWKRNKSSLFDRSIAQHTLA